MRRLKLLPAIALCVLTLCVLAGCSQGPEWDPSLGTITSSALMARLRSTDTAELREVPASEARQRRDDALAALRKEDGGSAVADVLTEAFAQGNAGVPVYVGLGQFGGQRAIAVIEAYGPATGKLAFKRLWILSETGEPLYSSTSK